MAVKGLLFDLDGVVVDTAKYHFLAWRRMANELGFDFNEAQNEQLKGLSRKKSISKILAWGGLDLSPADTEKYMALKNEWYVEYIDGMKPGEELPGAADFISTCKDLGYKIALGSASKNAKRILDKLQISSLFEAIIDGNEVTVSKPNPQVFLKGASALNIAPEQCVVFEDAIAGIEAAHNGGMKAIGIGDSQTLLEADAIYAGLKDIDPHRFLEDLD